MPKRKILKVGELSEDNQKFLTVLNSESDLSVIIIAVSFIDACLASLLRIKFKKSSVSDRLLSTSGVVGSVSARLDICYALDLVPKDMYQDIGILLQIRNEVAHHHFELDFEIQTVNDFCEKLQYVKNTKFDNTNDTSMLDQFMVGPRNRFVLTAVFISQRLMLIGLGLERSASV